MDSDVPRGYFRRRLLSAVPAQGGCILMYHQLRRPHRASRIRALCVAPELFAAQLGDFRAAEFHRGSLAEIRHAKEHRAVVTFDDGFANTLENGLSLLQWNGASAINYLVADRLGKTNDWDRVYGEPQQPLMDVAQVRDWLAGGQRIGAHTLTHPRLSRLTPEEARREIFDSKRKLEDLFGQPVDDFCYPYGDFDARVRDLVIEAGYRSAVSTRTGFVGPDADVFSLNRFMASHRKPGWLAWCPLLPATWV